MREVLVGELLRGSSGTREQLWSKTAADARGREAGWGAYQEVHVVYGVMALPLPLRAYCSLLVPPNPKGLDEDAHRAHLPGLGSQRLLGRRRRRG